VEFRDTLLPYNLAYYSASETAATLRKDGFAARQIVSPTTGPLNSIEACKADKDCRQISPRIAIFMAPVTIASVGPKTAQIRAIPPSQTITIKILGTSVSVGIPGPTMLNTVPSIQVPVPPPPIPTPTVGGHRVCVPWC
jgi:hypothetical protein